MYDSTGTRQTNLMYTFDCCNLQMDADSDVRRDYQSCGLH
jgi:hypothetical protein